MSAIETISMITMGMLVVVEFILNRFQRVLIERYKKILNDKYANDIVILDFALRSIFKTAIEDEDYETAQRCATLIKQLKESKKEATT